MLGLGANLAGKFWLLLLQLFTVSVFTAHWGAYGYGQWIMLATIPTYISLSGMGFGTAAAIDMTQQFALNNRAKVLSAYQSVWALMSTVMVAVLAVVVGGYLLVEFTPALHRTLHPDDKIALTIVVLAAFSVLVMQMSIVSVGFQATKRYALGTFLMDLSIPVEGLGVIVCCSLGYGILGVALSMLIFRAIGLICYYLVLLYYEPWLQLGFSHVSLSEICRLSHPAMASVSMTLSTSLSLQGVVTAIGLFMSPALAAVFATARFLTRIPLQFVGLTSRATLPEMAAAYSQGRPILSAKLALLNLVVTGLVAFPFAGAFIFFGPSVTSLLSHGKLHASASLLFWLGLTAAIQATWNTVGQFLFAINKQHSFSYYYIVLGALSAAAPLLIGKTGRIETVALVWCLAELAMLVVVYRAWWRESDVSLSAIREAMREMTTRFQRPAPEGRI